MHSKETAGENYAWLDYRIVGAGAYRWRSGLYRDCERIRLDRPVPVFRFRRAVRAGDRHAPCQGPQLVDVMCSPAFHSARGRQCGTDVSERLHGCDHPQVQVLRGRVRNGKQPARAGPALFNATCVSRMLNVAFAALFRYPGGVCQAYS